MAQVLIRLLDTRTANRSAIELIGDQPGSGQDITLTALRLVRPGVTLVEATIVGDTIVPGSIVEDDGNGGLKLKSPTIAVHRSYQFELPVANQDFFGIHFDVTAGVLVRLDLNLGASGAAQPAIVLEVLGKVRLDGTPAAPEFSSVAVGYRGVWESLPQFPTTQSIELEVVLPSQFPWPSLRVPFDLSLKFPSIVDTIRLPARTAPIASLPLSWGWDGITISHIAENIVVEIQRLRVVGLLDLFVSLKLTFKPDDVIIEKTDGGNGFDLANIRFRQIGDGCFGIDAKSTDLSKLLQLISSEIPSVGADGTSTEFQLRVHAPDGELTELRLDWKLDGAAKMNIPLPGFKFTLPAPERMSLVAKPDGEDCPDQVVIAATFPPAMVKLAATFGWHGSEDKQEKLPDSKPVGASDSPLALEFETAKHISVALFSFSCTGSGNPRFMRKLAIPLPALEELETNLGADGEDDMDIIRVLTDPYPNTSLATESISVDDIKPNTLKLTLPGTPYAFPFLGDPNIKQIFEVVELTDPPPQANNAIVAAPAQDSGLKIRKLLKLRIKLDDFVLEPSAILTFDLERMGFSVDPSTGIPVLIPGSQESLKTSKFGLNFTFRPNANRELFRLVIQERNYAIRQSEGAVFTVDYDKVTMPGDSLEFAIRDFAVTPKGLSLQASITDKQARLNGLETQFRFTEGVLQITDNNIAGFTIVGSGPIPPDLVGDAVADIGLQFAQENSNLTLVRGSAKIKGSKLLSCKATRFDFQLDALGLNFVRENGADHLYFTLSGKARYVMQSGDDSSGPLAWLPGIEIQLVDCPLTGNARVIAKHVKFLIELPKKLRFSFLGCFTMELRSIGFVPQFDKLGDVGAMRLGGQIMLGDTGDLIDAKIDLHDLYVALPEKGSFVPRLYLKSLGIRIAQGDTFALEANVDFYNGEEIEPGIKAFGFTGEGSVAIKGLPPIAASMAWVRVSRDGNTWSRAWFIYLEARRMSIRIPVVEIYIREIGFGFGYRYTLAAFKAIDETSDVRKLLKKLKEISVTQGNLSKRSAWRVDLEEQGEDPRWTVAMRALFASSSLQTAVFTGYDEKKEAALPSLYILDAVLAVRSDLTFFLAGRAWLNTNYHDFNTNESIRNGPLLNGFMMLSPKQSRFLANLSSNPGAQFGDHPPLPGFVKDLLRDSRFTATLLVEPGLIHYELGWPNQLQANAKVGPLTVQIRAGQIFRLSTSELVVGQSYLARGRLELKAEFSAGFFGAGLYALADVAYGMRYIGVIAFDDPLKNSAFYGAVGLDIRVVLEIKFWLRIKIGFIKISIDLSVSISIQFTAALQIGIAMPEIAGALGTATICVRVMGRNLGFNVRVGINDGAVESARLKTERFLHIGLEAEEVEAVPGTQANTLTAAVHSQPHPPMPITLTQSGIQTSNNQNSSTQIGQANPSAVTSSLNPPGDDSSSTITGAGASTGQPALLAATAAPAAFVTPEYYAGIAESAAVNNTILLMLVPASATEDLVREGFLAVPPSDEVAAANDLVDFTWQLPSEVPATLEVSRWKTTANADATAEPIDTGKKILSWAVAWAHAFDSELNTGESDNQKRLFEFLRYAFLYDVQAGEDSSSPNFGKIIPRSDPLSYLHTSKQVQEDARVSNPSTAAFEAAVRGAAEQFAAPYFKFDPNSEYDRNLLEACRPSTTVYAENGKATGDANGPDAPTYDQLALELRSSLVQAMTRDFFEYAALKDENSPRAIELREKSLLFRFGLLLKVRVRVPQREDDPLAEAIQWLSTDQFVGKLKQRTSPNEKTPSNSERVIKLFNPPTDWFRNRPPQFARVRQFEHANTIAIDWRLEFPTDRDAIGVTVQDDPEHHLRHYLVRREHLDGNDPTVTFTLKSAEVLHRTVDGDGKASLLRLPTRFQLVDHFADQNAEDVAALTASGKLYLYTITPIDVAGTPSPRPLSVVARRLPADPPLVPTDGEVQVTYELKPQFNNVLEFENDLLIDKPRLQTPQKFVFRFSDPIEPDNRPSVPIDKYYLVFRREAVLPVGFYGADENVRGATSKTLAISNARRLRTDVVVELTGKILPDVERADSGRSYRRVEVDIETLQKNRVLSKSEDWRAEGWTVFVQTESKVGPSSDDGVRAEGILSNLAPVSVRFQFVNSAQPEKREQRQFTRLEWLPKPMRLDLLAPEDTCGEVGFAKVPMPVLEGDGSVWKFDPTQMNIRFEQHPSRLRAVKVVWNQGPSESNDHPIDLYARYQLYEFDVWANPADVLRPTTPQYVDFSSWSQKAQLHSIQEVDLVPSNSLANLPTNIKEPQAWEAWYPGTSRRLMLKQKMKDEGTWPAERDTTYGPWYSFRDSYLVWPDPHDLLQTKDVNGQQKFDKRLRSFHPFFEDLAAWIGRVVTDQPTARYTVELGPQPACGSSRGGENVQDVNPTKSSQPSSSLDKLMQVSPTANDPYGWSLLQQMGLAVGIRLRRTSDGEFEQGQVLLENLNRAIAAVKSKRTQKFVVVDSTIRDDQKPSLRLRLRATARGQCYRLSSNDQGPIFELPYKENATGENDSPIIVTRFVQCDSDGKVTLTTWTNGNQISVEPPKNDGTERERDNCGNPEAAIDHQFNLNQFLHVEYLFQPGKRTRIELLEKDNAGVAEPEEMLSLVQLSLRPAVQQLYRYQQYEFSGLPPRVDITIKFTVTGNVHSTYIVETGQPMSPIKLNAGDNTVVLTSTLVGTLGLIVRTTDPNAVVVKGTYKLSNGNVVEVDPTSASRLVLDWISTSFTYNDNPLVFPDDGNAKQQWQRFLLLVKCVDESLVDDRFENGTLDNEKSQLLLGWLDRFFGTGGDVALHGDLAKTGEGPWIAAAYPRHSSPIPLTPDAAGRLTYYRPIESQWGQAYRYLVRPRGRYELLWEELGRSRSLELTPPAVSVEQLQARLQAPRPGGVDVILSRIRSLAAPMVRSSRRLDLPAPPGSVSSPGRVWEVLLAEHPEQELIDHNRTLVHRLEYQRTLQSNFRTFNPNDHGQDHVNRLLSRTRTRLHHRDDPNLVPQNIDKLFLYYGADDPKELDIHADRRLSAVEALINSHTGETRIECEQIQFMMGGSRLGSLLELRPKDDFGIKCIPQLALRTGTELNDPDQDLLTKPLDTFESAIDWPESARTHDGKELPKLDAQPDEHALTPEGLIEIDLPLRTEEFSHGTLAVQYDALPFYYRHQLLLVAQAASVVSEITPVTQQEFEYQSARIDAVMDAADGPSEFSVRSIRIPMVRLWDSLPESAQQMWSVEDPMTAGPNKIRPGGLLDTATIYSIVIEMPGSGNVQVVAEYRFDTTSMDKYCVVSVDLPGPFQGAVIRVSPSRSQERPMLETMLMPKDRTTAITVGSISSREVVKKQPILLQWPTSEELFPRNCELRTLGPATNLQLAAMKRLLPIVDPGIADALRKLIASADQESVAVTCIGLEQLSEIHDQVAIDIVNRKVTWTGSISAAQVKVFEEWEKTSLFAATLTELRTKIQAGGAADFTVAIVEPFWKPRSTLFAMEPTLVNFLAIADGVFGVNGFLQRSQAQSLLATGGLSVADKNAIKRLYRAALNSGLGGGKLKLSVRRGSATSKLTEIITDL